MQPHTSICEENTCLYLWLLTGIGCIRKEIPCWYLTVVLAKRLNWSHSQCEGDSKRGCLCYFGIWNIHENSWTDRAMLRRVHREHRRHWTVEQITLHLIKLHVRLWSCSPPSNRPELHKRNNCPIALGNQFAEHYTLLSDHMAVEAGENPA